MNTYLIPNMSAQASMKTTNRDGWTELLICDTFGYREFLAISDILENNFNLIFTEKLNGLDENYWDFAFNESLLTLHYHYMTGVIICPFALVKATEGDNNNVIEIGKKLSQYFLGHKSN